jgi:hypothetical protein
MTLTALLVALIIVGAVLYVVRLLPLDATVKTIIQVIAVVILAIWLIRTFLPMAGL